MASKRTNKSSNASVYVVIAIVIVLSVIPFTPIAADLANDKLADEIAVSALLLTIGGFGITTWQLLRTRNASIAASDAVQNLQLRLEAFEDSQLCSDALAILSEVDRWHMFAASTPSKVVSVLLADRYRALQSLIVELRARLGSTWSDEQRQTGQEAVTKLVDARRSALKYISPKSTAGPPSLGPLQKSLRNLLEMLTALSVDLNQKATEGKK